MNFFLDSDVDAELCAQLTRALSRGALNDTDDTAGTSALESSDLALPLSTARVGSLSASAPSVPHGEPADSPHAERQQLDCEPRYTPQARVRNAPLRQAACDEAVRRATWPSRRREDVSRKNDDIYRDFEAAHDSVKVLMATMETSVIDGTLHPSFVDLAEDLWLVRDELDYIRCSIPYGIVQRQRRYVAEPFAAAGGIPLIRESAKRAAAHIRKLLPFYSGETLVACLEVMAELSELRRNHFWEIAAHG